LRAEGVGFEPTRSVNPFRFSRPVPSATRRALQGKCFTLALKKSHRTSCHEYREISELHFDGKL
jgi:hypothetical protein